jgi:hypothetical protein
MRSRRKDPNGKVLNSNDAAKLLAVTASTLSRWRAVNRGPRFVQDGGVIRCRLDILEAYLAGDVTARMDSLQPAKPPDRIYSNLVTA